MKKSKKYQEYVRELESKLTHDYGHLLTGDVLMNLLGFKSVNAFQQALHRNAIDVPIFTIEKRRGKFALAKDVAEWLTQMRFAVVDKQEPKGGN